MDHGTVVGQQYDRWARVYDGLWGWYTASTVGRLVRWTCDRPDDEVSSGRILDVGCGTGAFAQQLLTTGCSAEHVTGVDLSDEMLAAARRKLRAFPNTRFEQADAAALPFADDRFDLVVSASTLHYLPDPQVALAEMSRVVKPEGRLLVLDWCRDDPVTGLIDAVLRRFDPAHGRCYTQAELHRMLRTAGVRRRRAERFRVLGCWGMMISEGVRGSEGPV